MLATGIFIVAVSSGLAGIAQTYAQLLVLRGVGGVGSAMFTVSAMTLLLGSVDPGRRGRAHGRLPGRLPARRDDRSGDRRVCWP